MIRHARSAPHAVQLRACENFDGIFKRDPPGANLQSLAWAKFVLISHLPSAGGIGLASRWVGR